MKHIKKTSLLIGSLIIALIVSSPYLLYISESISPDIIRRNNIWNN